MSTRVIGCSGRTLILWGLLALALVPSRSQAAEKLIGIHSAKVVSQSMPWIAQEAGLFQKYQLDFQLLYMASSPMGTTALLSGDADVALTGGAGIVNAVVQGATDLVFIGAVKSVMTQSILSRPEMKKPEELKGKKIGVSRIGSNTHYFTVQALRRFGLDPARDVTFIQTGGEFETLAALEKGAIEAGTMTAPGDAKAVSLGFHYLVYGPDLRIPYAATAFVTRRSSLAKRPQVIGQFMRVMAEAAKILHTDREFTYKVLSKELRLSDRGVLDAAYNSEIKFLDPKLSLKPEAIQAIIDEIAQSDARARNMKAQDLIDRRYLDEMEKSGFFESLWAVKR